ncbi:CPBP family intramembrane glutamic endopeptidase [Cognatilysobacter lacus]|uniref:CPBP family intramembrane metalloprotease n=1 Tax=Cognatilysobacter lacus TaxID=1643323 RepID=A0A5D8Z4F8_9GAMM|nr:type II CAAX endopeptidase family protein [Lysobacter lacus]TZF89629.1 CPBP family intramembrane metalloprotease [Lysobacter lacus]
MEQQPPPSANRSPGRRLLSNPVVRILLGTLLVWLPAPLVTKTAHALIPAPYGHLWPTVLAALLVWLAYRFFVLRVERRPVSELSTPGAFRELASGLLVGVSMQALLFGVLWVLGVYRVDGLVAPSSAMLAVVPLYVGVALLEEFVGRGIVFGISRQALGTLWAVVISALFFGLVHAPNVGANPIGLLTCTAFGMLFAAAYMATGRLWLCIGIHFAWNFAQSQVFSSLVSGTSDGTGLIRGHLTGPDWLTGGSFGSEGSVVALALALIGFAAFMVKARARDLGVVGGPSRPAVVVDGHAPASAALGA